MNNTSTLDHGGGGGHGLNPNNLTAGQSSGFASAAIGNPAEMDKWHLETERGMGFRCRRHAGPLVAGLLSMLALFSPILMVALPKLQALRVAHLTLKCGIECDGMLVTLAFKLFTLAVGTWGVFYRRPRATLPRIHIYRALVSLLILVFLVSYWLFYVSHIMQESGGEQLRRIEYKSLVQYALNLVDALLFVHYLAIVLMELRHRQTQFYIKVVRSPDGESKGFPIGCMSVQRAAAHVLDQYYTSFPIYNPFLDRMTGAVGLRQRGKNGVKVYDVDGPNVSFNAKKLIFICLKRVSFFLGRQFYRCQRCFQERVQFSQ